MKLKKKNTTLEVKMFVDKKYNFILPLHLCKPDNCLQDNYLGNSSVGVPADTH